METLTEHPSRFPFSYVTNLRGGIPDHRLHHLACFWPGAWAWACRRRCCGVRTAFGGQRIRHGCCTQHGCCMAALLALSTPLREHPSRPGLLQAAWRWACCRGR